jgi:hypothetical protein
VTTALVIGLTTGDSGGARFAKTANGTNPQETVGEGPIGGWEAYKSAERTYPASVVGPAVVENARATFDKIGQAGSSQGNNHWQPYAPLSVAQQPGVLAFSGSTDTTASRVTAMLIASGARTTRSARTPSGPG